MIAPPKVDKPAPKRRTSPLWPFVVAVAGVFLAIAFVFYLAFHVNSGAQTDNAKPKTGKPGQIPVRPAKASTRPDPTQVRDDVSKGAVDEPKTNQWGNPAHWGHKKLRPKVTHRIDRSQMPLFEQLFLNRADKTIAGLLVIEPGTDLIGEEIFDESFVKAFLKSLEDPIEILADDRDEAKSLKRAVIETKAELKARYDAGEDIAKILTDTRRELRELGAYREELKKHLDDLRREANITVEDMKRYVEAANVMLEERGAKKIVMPEFYYRQIEFRNRMRKELKGE